MRTLLFAILMFMLAGCAALRRSDKSGYSHLNGYENEQPNQGRDRKQSERQAAARELGLVAGSSLNGAQESALEARLALKRAERNLEGRREREQYFKNKPYIRTDRERLELLSLDGFESRQRWLNAKGIQSATFQHPPGIQTLIDVNDIAVGFTKQAVRDSWGEPDLVEVAGNPVYGNERWHYAEQTSSAEGYHTQNRMVYFESGRVVGWETD